MVPKTCSIDGCDKQEKPLRRGMCRTHYDAWYRKTPLSERMPLHPEIRFWQKVDKRSPDECWNWQGPAGQQGYGAFNFARGKTERTHRIALRLKLGRDLLPGAYACHTCDNRMCCNPAHLYEGTPLSNVADAVSRGRNSRGTGRPQSKLTEDDVLAIRHRAAAGEVNLHLAEEFGVSPGKISEITHGTTWVHIGGPRSFKQIHAKRKKAA